ncbi:hypothetical protein MNB_SUP05-SYMBIONT-4-399 [hydrothermal vent metagenome]|uniref:Uncharacterized protein n=1 Tax=hydrothermal vent metagenome TaxID=652676 RepID=A0A1W1DW20_9ZZZZ
MIEKSIRIDEEYGATFDKFVANSKGAIKVVDVNLEYDPYFYERKKSIEETVRQVDSGEMAMLDFNKSMDEIILDLSKNISEDSQYNLAPLKGR